MNIKRHFESVSNLRGFSLNETLIVTVLSIFLIVAVLSAMSSLDQSSRRLSEHISSLSIAQGELEELRTMEYNPPNAPFGSEKTENIKEISIALDKDGVNYQLPGKITTTMIPQANGHFVTVTVEVGHENNTVVTDLETVINKFSNGQQ